MRHLTFTEADIRDLLYYRYHHPHPRVQLRMEVVWLKSQGLPHQEISRLAGVSANTVRRYLDAFAHGGIAELQRVHFRRPHSELDTHAESLADYFREHPPATIKEARAKIEELTGIQRSPTQVRSFFRRLGLRRRKVGRLTVVWDNAPYFLDGKVRALAALLGIELLPLPSHSPNLNLIERLWRFLKKQCLYSKYYADFSSFQGHILHELAVTPAKYRKELASLLTLNFQNLEESFLHTIGEDEEPVGTDKRVA